MEEKTRERTITVKMSDEDCRELANLSGEHGLTVGELLTNFIGDLIGGTQSNGSDERMYAKQWFDRCWFAQYPENTMLHHLLFWGHDPKNYLGALDSLVMAQMDMEALVGNPDGYDEEDLSFINDDIAYFRERLKEMTGDWKPDTEPDMEEQLEIIKKFVKQREQLINEGDEKNERAADKNNGEASAGHTKDVGV